MWRIECSGEKEALELFMQPLEEFSKAISFFKKEESSQWLLEALCDARSDVEKIKDCFERVAAAAGVPCPFGSADELPEKDWLAENRQSFPALCVGRFYIHGSHIQEPAPLTSVALQIDAATAFGTGEHASTSGCLRALEDLHVFYEPETALDMGCGSGILAMAAARLWPTLKVTAVDIDLEAVRVAKANCVLNKVDRQVVCLLSEGFKELDLQKPFDLITANILADPLADMAPELSHFLKLDGFAILSGILASQSDHVLKAYQNQGLALYKTDLKGDWVTLILQKRLQSKRA